ncbi:MAG: AAA family ATPase [Geodermatophilaceae bacterium]
MRLQIRQSYKSLKPGDAEGVDLPRFTVLTGQNGAGKSNLLEAINEGYVYVEDIEPVQQGDIRLFQLGELLVVAEGSMTAANYKEPWAGLFNSVQGWKTQAQGQEGLEESDALNTWILQQAMSSRSLTRAAAERMRAETGKTLQDMTADDFRKYGPLLAGIKDPFTTSITEVFLSYAQRRYENDVALFILEQQGRGSALTPTEFMSRFGPPPWDLLDDALRLVSLPYTFVPPPDTTENASYEVTLLDEQENQIGPGELSSGERVLLVVALSLYTGTRLMEAIQLPKLLLLDEADASLHPSMVKNLLSVIEEIFVKQYGVTVMLTTHSPTTVALAPIDSLYLMSRFGVKLRQASIDEALAVLTSGLSTLSVRQENRRQIFVESEYDQGVFQDLYSVLKGHVGSHCSAEFIAAGRRERSGGCDTVKRLVAELRDAGITTVFGVVDRDNRQGSPSHVYYIEDRYSIENLLFDPLLLGYFLIRKNIVKPAGFSLPPHLRHFEISEVEAPAVIASVAKKLGLAGDMQDVTYIGGFTAAVPRQLLDMNGHELEKLVTSTFPQLRRFKDGLLREVAQRAFGDKPQFAPRSLLDLLTKIVT